MKIRTPWLKGIISKTIKKFVRNSLGVDLDFIPGDITVSIKDGKLVGHISGDFSVKLDDLNKTKAMKLLED